MNKRNGITPPPLPQNIKTDQEKEGGMNGLFNETSGKLNRKSVKLNSFTVLYTRKEIELLSNFKFSICFNKLRKGEEFLAESLKRLANSCLS